MQSKSNVRDIVLHDFKMNYKATIIKGVWLGSRIRGKELPSMLETLESIAISRRATKYVLRQGGGGTHV